MAGDRASVGLGIRAKGGCLVICDASGSSSTNGAATVVMCMVTRPAGMGLPGP